MAWQGLGSAGHRTVLLAEPAFGSFTCRCRPWSMRWMGVSGGVWPLGQKEEVPGTLALSGGFPRSGVSSVH